MYAITAVRVIYRRDGWTVARPLPTFYLNENVQGIMSEAHAENIVRDIIKPDCTPSDAIARVELNVCAVKVD
jgi:hypothetical protein